MVVSSLGEDHVHLFYRFNGFSSYPFSAIEIPHSYSENARNYHHCNTIITSDKSNNNTDIATPTNNNDINNNKNIINVHVNGKDNNYDHHSPYK